MNDEALREKVHKILVVAKSNLKLAYPDDEPTLDELHIAGTTLKGIHNFMAFTEDEILHLIAEDRDRMQIELKADLARAMGHMEGCGHPDKYLLSRHPDLAALTNKSKQGTDNAPSNQ